MSINTKDGIIYFQDGDLLDIQKEGGIVLLHYHEKETEILHKLDLSNIRGIEQKILHEIERYTIRFISKNNDLIYVVKFASHIKCHSIFKDIKDKYGIRDLDYLKYIESFEL